MKYFKQTKLLKFESDSVVFYKHWREFDACTDLQCLPVKVLFLAHFSEPKNLSICIGQKSSWHSLVKIWVWQKILNTLYVSVFIKFKLRVKKWFLKRKFQAPLHKYSGYAKTQD